MVLYPLKTSENLWFCDAFRGYKNRTVTWSELPAYKSMFNSFMTQSLSYSKSVDWFLFDTDLRHDRVKVKVTEALEQGSKFKYTKTTLIGVILVSWLLSWKDSISPFRVFLLLQTAFTWLLWTCLLQMYYVPSDELCAPICVKSSAVISSSL